MQDEFKRLHAVVRTLAESVSLTSTDAAAAWNQKASLPPLPLPAVEDPESVNPSDTSPPPVASIAVALITGRATYNNFNDNSSAADNNISITADGRSRTTISSPADFYEANTSTTTSSTSDCGDVSVDAAASTTTNCTSDFGDVGVDATASTTTSSTYDCVTSASPSPPAPPPALPTIA